MVDMIIVHGRQPCKAGKTPAPLLPTYLVYLPTYLSLVAAAASLPTLPSSYYSSFYTLLQNAILQIEHKHIVTITFLFHMFFTVSYDVNLA